MWPRGNDRHPMPHLECTLPPWSYKQPASVIGDYCLAIKLAGAGGGDNRWNYRNMSECMDDSLLGSFGYVDPVAVIDRWICNSITHQLCVVAGLLIDDKRLNFYLRLVCNTRVEYRTTSRLRPVAE